MTRSSPEPVKTENLIPGMEIELITTTKDDLITNVVDVTTTIEDIETHARENTAWLTHNVLWDLREMNFKKIDSTAAKSLIERSEEVGKLRQKSLRTAFLVDDDHAFALSRMFGSLIDDTGFRTRVFRSKEDALEWLREKRSG